MITRRRFLTTSAVFGATLVGAPRYVLEASAADTVITILHTNDTHSQIDPLPENDKNAGKGGVARRATLVKRIRKENVRAVVVLGILKGKLLMTFMLSNVIIAG